MANDDKSLFIFMFNILNPQTERVSTHFGTYESFMYRNECVCCFVEEERKNSSVLNLIAKDEKKIAI
jgi:hypothetical protein